MPGCLFTLAILATLLAYTLYSALIQNWGASRATMIGYTVPVIAITIGAVSNAEPITITLILGTLLIVGGVALTDFGASIRKPAQPTPVAPRKQTICADPSCRGIALVE